MNWIVWIYWINIKVSLYFCNFATDKNSQLFSFTAVMPMQPNHYTCTFTICTHLAVIHTSAICIWTFCHMREKKEENCNTILNTLYIHLSLYTLYIHLSLNTLYIHLSLNTLYIHLSLNTLYIHLSLNTLYIH
jgi:hypothetical protein